MSALQGQLDILAASITDKTCSQGTCACQNSDTVLYYGSNRAATRLDLSTATGEELDRLAQACDPATFGVNQTDVLDETYRKAGKMDVSNFSSNFSLEHSGLLNTIRSTLLEGHDEKKIIEAELYKLNVYGKGSFFKAHKDTPHSERMFASLVVVFPTPHEGGTFLLRHRGQDWTFDSGKMLAEQSTPSIAYVAFYSDVEHEVTPVISGHRVTLTYNLYFAVAPEPAILSTVTSNEIAFKATLSKLLADSSFLPNGGTLGFGLRYQYPITFDEDVRDPCRYSEDGVLTKKTVLPGLVQRLKGSDSIVARVCTDFSLKSDLRVIYKADDSLVMCDGVYDLSAYTFGIDDCKMTGLIRYKRGKVIKLFDLPSDRWRPEVDAKNTEEVMWVTQLTTFTRSDTAYIAYGNEARVGHMYGDICLIVRVGKAGNRSTL